MTTNLKKTHTIGSIELFSTTIKTPLGSLIALSDENALCFLGFTDNPETTVRIGKLLKKIGGIIVPGSAKPLTLIEQEFKLYFAHKLHIFTTPIRFYGTPFQEKIWHALSQIPYGTTKSYKEQAQIVGHSSAYRAVGTAHSANNLPIIIPCHRVLTHSGTVGGYNGGIARKQWLLSHESKVQKLS